MRLEDIYEILKTSVRVDYYIPENHELVFVYKDNISFSISKESEEKVFEGNFFFNSDGSEINDLAPADELVKELCRLKNFPETYKNIYSQVWSLKYNGQVIYTIECGMVRNLSSLHAAFPLSLNIFDYEMNFIEICNEYYGSSTMQIAKSIINSRVIVNKSTYQDFEL
ncbi:hypothetical protein [Sulfuricurvum sp.]|uniref:hypothetical protein n=1 Tax=Sulfuricurvum sp. TaxID=2025608 RepID=UPI002606631E|nr:hypothetical protein [Sulfuricurvum sp.]MDD2780261.1 hypothetical protein [Sulfuricurvum sp.]